MYTGSCLCEAVSFEVSEPLSAPDACHCDNCRRQSGHYWASTDVSGDALTLDDETHLRWFHSSDQVRRGFCAKCGSSLFWDPIDHDTIAVAMGAFDGPTDTQLEMHIFVAEQGDYYEITDELPQNAH